MIMVGFSGPLTPAVLADWTRHQYGGLLVVNLNHNGSSALELSPLIQQLRAVVRHRLVAATDQEGGGVCIDVTAVPCKPMPVGRSDTTTMAAALKSIGFDLDLGPVSDVCSGSILSDDMEMGAITSSTPAPEAAVEFLVAGGDMVMIAHDLSVADATYDAIKAAVESGRLPRARLDEAVAALTDLPS